MSKSVLVMNTPEKCLDCPLLNDEDKCIVQDDEANSNTSDSWDELRKGCPLKPLPEKEEDWMDDYYRGHADGWNDCLYKITGDVDVLC